MTDFTVRDLFKLETMKDFKIVAGLRIFLCKIIEIMCIWWYNNSEFVYDGRI